MAHHFPATTPSSSTAPASSSPSPADPSLAAGRTIEKARLDTHELHGQEENLLRLAAAAAFGYLAGTFPASDLAATLASRMSGEPLDLRQAGSRNPGALNAAKSLGTTWGAGVLAADVAKGWLGSTLGRRLAGDNGAYLAGFATVAGHVFPAWNGFRGGKGVATSSGACLACFPVYFPVDLTVAGLALVASKRAEKATYVASALFVVAAAAWHRFELPNGGGPRATIGLPLFATSTTALIYYRFLTAPAIPEESSDNDP